MFILVRNSLILAIGFYLSAIFLPEVLHINETVSKYLMVILAGLLILRSRNKWWFNMVSVILGLVIFLIFLEMTLL
ncbi:hypothetical protein AS52_01808 [Priestia megaterium Q3]|uniref:Uncharacterized protein n=1 Tax=Priestia megaterium Q3 TaxID=1452722 RepID=A0A806U442_PRIMG|nr:hypothetical protein AS52_01808 [Priestia megaterium Q3]QFY72619.1 hypothetical protein CEQ83_08830 [Priestia megaterium]